MAVDDIGTIRATYIDPTGTTWELSNTSDTLGWFTAQGISGWGATSYNFVTDNLVEGGVAVRNIRGEEVRLLWPLHIWGDTHQAFVDRMHAIRRAITMTAHRSLPGTLRIERPDPTANRECQFFYEDGFKGAGGDEDWIFQNPKLTLFVPDGCWLDVNETTIERTFAAGVSWFAPFRTVSDAHVLGETEIDNDGDLRTFPTWTIQGPMSSVTAINRSTGKAFTITYDLGPGQQISIDTRIQAAFGPDGANMGNFINYPAARLWALEPGLNKINFAMQDATLGSGITLAYKRRWDGA